MKPSSIQVQIKDEFPDTHCFLYKSKKYPFKFEFFKLSSKYFFNHKEELEKCSVISLLDEENEHEINLNDNDIDTFIKYVHRQIVTISNDNVFSLNYLANKYEVLSLIDVTKEFISDHHQELVLPILSLHQNDSIFETKLYEKIISDNLSEYIDNDQLLTLKIPAIHRILKEYKLNQKDDKKMSEKIVTFLFRCLDKFGVAASCLFEFVDISSMKNDCLNRLLTDYSNSFDFHFINRSFLQNLYETQSKILRNQEQQENDIVFIKSELKKLQNEQQEKICEKDRQINDLLNEVTQLKSEMTQIKKDQNQQNDKIEKQIKCMDDKIGSKLKFNHDDNKEFNGIINFLKTKSSEKIENVIDITSSSICSNDRNSYDPYYSVLYEDKSKFFYSVDRPNSWLKFDFKEHSIIPFEYTIRTINFNVGYIHLRNWVVEGSKNDVSWEILDEENNCSYLNGPLFYHTFKMNNQNLESFRYIRIRSTGVTWYGCNHLPIESFEIYGDYI